MALNLGNLLRRINCLCKRLEDLETVVDGLEGGTELPLFTEGSVLFAAPDGSITEDNTNFFWDNANNRLGIGTNAPDVSLHVAGYVKLRPADIILYGTPPIDFAQTWNAASTITGFSMAITDTLSNSGSLLMDLLVGGTSRFKVRKDGRITTAETIEFTNALTNNTTPTGFLTLSSPTLGRARYSTVVQMQTALGVIGGTALTAGYVAFGNGTGITGESGFFYNTTTNFLGLGNDAPMTKLNVSDTISTSPRGILSSQYSSDTAGARVGFSKARGTVTVPTVIVAGDVIGSLVFRGYDGTFANYVESASIEVVSTGTIAHASGRVPSYMTFSTSTDAAPSVLTERMRINSEGSVSLPSSGLNASLPMLTMTGTWYASGTATTTKPHFLIEPAGAASTNWDLVGTAIGVNAATGYLGKLIDLQKTAVSMFYVNYRGDVKVGRSITFGQAGAASVMYSLTTTNGTPDNSGTNIQIGINTTTQSATAGGYSVYGAGVYAHTSGNQYFNLITSSFGAGAGSANYRPFGILYTINNSGVQSGTATGIFLNATETALNSMTHNLMDLQVGGSSKFLVTNAGAVTATSHLGSNGGYVFAGGSSTSQFLVTGSGAYVGAASFASFKNQKQGSVASGSGIYSGFENNGTVSQTGTATGIWKGFYNNPSSVSSVVGNYEAFSSTVGSLKLADNLIAGSGSLANSLVNLTQTWNTTGTPTAINLNITNTASNAASQRLDLQVGGTSQFKIGVGGVVVTNNVVRLKGYTVATLPAGTVGDTAYVTDALAPAWGVAIVGGGAVVCPVFYNGAWVAG